MLDILQLLMYGVYLSGIKQQTQLLLELYPRNCD